MEEAELAEKLLSGIEKRSSAFVADEILDGISETRMVSLKEAVVELREQIAIREKLHKDMLQDIEDLKSSINNMMPQVPNPSIEWQKAMVEMKKKIIDAEEMKVQEKLNCFRDVALLKKELREWIRELRDKEKRADLLGDILGK